MKILLTDFGTPFDLDTPYKEPLGGSETSLLLLAKGLSELGQQVVLLTTLQKIETNQSNIIRNHVNYFVPYAEQSDIIICNRIIPEQIMPFIGKKRIFYYSHDAYDQQHVKWMMNQNSTNLLEKILCVSNWQKDTFNKYMNVPDNKLFVLGNSIDLSLYSGYTERVSNSFIFASIPYKGENLAEIFNQICIKTKKKLTLKVFSSFKMYGDKTQDEQYSDFFRALSQVDGIKINNSISMKDLAYEFASSSFVLFPNTYHESFNMNCVQAQAAGCIPISTNSGAMNERIEHGYNGFLIKEPNILNIDTMNNFVSEVDRILNLSEDHLYLIRLQARKTAEQYDYIKIADKFLNMLEGK